ncbi:MAG: DMT family transporter [Clostridia bacterium]|nr:DMT family transporter [Clostridia bacterium]
MGQALHNRKLGTLLIIISATGFAFLAIFVKYAYAAGLNTLTMLSIRFLIAAVIMWVIVWARKENPRIDRKKIVQLAMLGVMGYGVMSGFYFNAVNLVPAAIASIILYTYPLLVTLLAAWMFKEAITRTKLLSLVISSLGLVMVVGVAFDGLNPKGLLYAAMAAVVYSLYIVYSNKLVGRVNPMLVTTYVITSAAVVLTLITLVSGSVVLPTGSQGWWSLLGIAVFSTVIAILTFFQGMSIVGPSQASIISTLEPVVTALAAFLLLAEKVSVTQFLGGLLVIGAVILIQKDEEVIVSEQKG